MNPHIVVFCPSITHKLILLAEHAQKIGDGVILVDDRYERLLEAYAGLDKLTQTILQDSLTLVAFGAREPVHGNGVKVLPLHSWDEIDCVLEAL